MKALIDELAREPRLGRFTIKRYRPITDKFTRALPFVSRLEDGLVRVLRRKWNGELFSECDQFSGHGDKRDDQVDAISGAYNMLAEIGEEVPKEKRYRVHVGFFGGDNTQGFPNDKGKLSGCLG